MVGETRSHIRPTQKQLKFVNSETEIGPEQTLASRLLDIGNILLLTMTNKFFKNKLLFSNKMLYTCYMILNMLCSVIN